MSERGCLPDGKFLNFGAKHVVVEHMDSTYINHLMHSIKNLTHNTTTLAAISGSAFGPQALNRNTFYDMNWNGELSATFTLPKGVPGTRVVLHCVGSAPADSWDGNGTLVVICDSVGIFKKQRLNFKNSTSAVDLTPVPIVSGHTDIFFVAGVPETNAFDGNTHNKLTMTMTAADNQTNIGARLSFYCGKHNEWEISFLGSVLGNGTMNVGGIVPGIHTY